MQTKTSCPDLKIRMISGAATSIDLHRFKDSDNIDFKATVIPDSIALADLSNWIRDRGMGSASGESVAILSESNTGYGTGVQDVIQGANESKAPFAQALSLRFPIYISELEQARQGAAAEASAANASPQTFHNPKLPLAPAASRERRDIVPIYSASEINTIELVLDQLLESIKQQRISCVIIAASNVEDAIFLAGEVRASSPNVMPISLNSSLLFLHSQVNPSTARGLRRKRLSVSQRQPGVDESILGCAEPHPISVRYRPRRLQRHLGAARRRHGNDRLRRAVQGGRAIPSAMDHGDR
jgi:hypothetical protein